MCEHVYQNKLYLGFPHEQNCLACPEMGLSATSTDPNLCPMSHDNKIDGKTSSQQWVRLGVLWRFSLIHFVPRVACHHFWGAVLFCFLLSLSFLCLLTDCSLKNYGLSISPDLNTLSPYFIAILSKCESARSIAVINVKIELVMLRSNSNRGCCIQLLHIYKKSKNSLLSTTQLGVK